MQAYRHGSGQFFRWQFFGVHAIIFCGGLLPWLLIASFWVNIFVLTRLAGSKVQNGFKHFVLGLPGLDTVLNGNFGCSFFRLKIRFGVDNWSCDDQIWFLESCKSIWASFGLDIKIKKSGYAARQDGPACNMAFAAIAGGRNNNQQLCICQLQSGPTVC